MKLTYYDGQFPLDGSDGFSAAEPLTILLSPPTTDNRVEPRLL